MAGPFADIRGIPARCRRAGARRAARKAFGKGPGNIGGNRPRRYAGGCPRYPGSAASPAHHACSTERHRPCPLPSRRRDRGCARHRHRRTAGHSAAELRAKSARARSVHARSAPARAFQSRSRARAYIRGGRGRRICHRNNRRRRKGRPASPAPRHTRVNSRRLAARRAAAGSRQPRTCPSRRRSRSDGHRHIGAGGHAAV